MGGEFLGLVTVSYAAYIKDKINIKNLIILFCLFNFSIYVHEINLLTIFVIHIILNNKYLTTINFLSISFFFIYISLIIQNLLINLNFMPTIYFFKNKKKYLFRWTF